MFHPNSRELSKMDKEVADLIAKEKESGSPLINRHLLVRHKRWSIMVAAFILTIIGVAVSSFKRRGGIGLNLALGVVLAFLYIFFDKIFRLLLAEGFLLCKFSIIKLQKLIKE